MHRALSHEPSYAFQEVEDGFADDDLLTSEDFGLTNSRSFLEREDFESELGPPIDPFAEDFTDIAARDIIQVIVDGDRVGRPVIVFYAHRLPSNKSFDHDKLLRYLLATLDNLVELDYTIVYFHYGLRSHNKPPLKWMFQVYKMLDRKYKKNLKALYVVHPTRFIRIVFNIFKPFISAKFEDKFHYVNSIKDLEHALSISRLNVPTAVREHDRALTTSSASNGNSRPASPPLPPRPSQQFDVALEFILAHHPDLDVPPIVTELIEFLEAHALDMEGIFRKSANVGSITRLQEKINRGETVDFVNDPEYRNNLEVASLHASVLLKTFLRSLGEPVTTNELYPNLAAIADIPKGEKTPVVKDFVALLPKPNYLLLKTVIHFLTKVAANHKVNLMTANNLSVVFGPNLTWPTDRDVPIAQLNNLNNFCYRLIVDYDKIFV